MSENKIKETQEYHFLKEEIYGNEETKTKGLKTIYLEEKDKLIRELKSIEDSYSKIAKNIKNVFQTIDHSNREYSTLNKTKIQNMLDIQDNLKETLEDNQKEEEIDNLIVSLKNEKKEIMHYTKKRY